MDLILLAAFFSIGASFFCSMCEASIISVPFAHVKHLSEGGSRAGKLLANFKADMSRPIAAILILNTLANTAGPAFAGVAAEDLYGETGVIVFAIVMTLAVLFLGEMIPKFLGVTYAKTLAPVMAFPLSILITICGPLIIISRWVLTVIEPAETQPLVSQEEVLSMAAIGTEEGALDHLEGSVISNVIGLDKLLVRDVLTPRVNVFRVEETTRLEHVARDIPGWNYTRVPVYAKEDPDHLTGYVRQRDIYREIVKGAKDLALKEIARPLEIVPELMRVDKLLLQMFEHREHICSVVDEHGALAGIITLEDIIEEVVGHEISDEYDDARTIRPRLNTSTK